MSERFVIKFLKGISMEDQRAIVEILRGKMTVSETPNGVVVETVMNMHQLHHLLTGKSGFGGIGKSPVQNDDGESSVQEEFSAGTLAW